MPFLYGLNTNIVPQLKPLVYTKYGAVVDTWYTAFDGSNVEFVALGVMVDNADEVVNLQVTIDGVEYTSFNTSLLWATNKCTTVSGMQYTSAAARMIVMSVPSVEMELTYNVLAAWMYGKAVKVEAKVTTDSNSDLFVAGLYKQR